MTDSDKEVQHLREECSVLEASLCRSKGGDVYCFFPFSFNSNCGGLRVEFPLGTGQDAPRWSLVSAKSPETNLWGLSGVPTVEGRI